MGFELNLVTNVPAVDQKSREMKESWEAVENSLKESAQKMKLYADRSRRDVPIYKEGDLVMLSTDHLGIKGWSKHLKDRYIGPYPVIRMVGPNAVELVLPGHLKIHPVINTE